MLIYENGDLLDEKYPIFCHQVNCKGVMGSGVARQIRDKYPIIYKEYREYCLQKDNKLGTNFYSSTLDGRICVNMFAQDGYGRDKRYTDYDAFKACLKDFSSRLNGWISKKWISEATIAFPYGIGCGLGGGDWTIISKMIEEFSETVPLKVIIVKKTA